MSPIRHHTTGRNRNLGSAENVEMNSFMKVATFAAVATAALHHGPPRLSPRLRLGRAPPVVLTAKKRTFEFCSVDDAGEIESCELVSSQVSQSAPRSQATRFQF